MLVYRVEDSEGRGPYRKRAGYVHEWSKDENGHNDYNHPSPYQDGLPGMWDMESYICGFKSKAQLKAWFSEEELSNLEALGFSIKTFEVPKSDVKVGGKQVIFLRPKTFIF